MSQKICQYDDRTGTKWCTRVPLPRHPYCPRPEGATVVNPDGSYTVYPRRCCAQWRHGCRCAHPPTIYVRNPKTGYEDYPPRSHCEEEQEEEEEEIVEIIRIRRPKQRGCGGPAVSIDPFRLPY